MPYSDPSSLCMYIIYVYQMINLESCICSHAKNINGLDLNYINKTGGNSWAIVLFQTHIECEYLVIYILFVFGHLRFLWIKYL